MKIRALPHGRSHVYGRNASLGRGLIKNDSQNYTKPYWLYNVNLIGNATTCCLRSPGTKIELSKGRPDHWTGRVSVTVPEWPKPRFQSSFAKAPMKSPLSSPFLRIRSVFRHPLIAGIAGTGALLAVAGPPLQADEEANAFFEKRIRPILAESCYECHSEEAGKRKGGLWLDRRSGWEVGGDSGPAIIPGDTENSLLLRSIRYHDPDLEMPPEKKLPDRVVTDFETWIQAGAFDPRSGESGAPESGIDLEKGREFWSFQPIRNPEPPAVKQEEWPRDPVDRFILARLEAKGLPPATDADRETLLRRASLVLTGLPPTLEEQQAFLADESPDAFGSVVDRLLASEAFAERWGRHWLDIMRYADTSGGGRAMPLPDAWRFRDYVIDSFHEDKPLDQLIREHIAGDLLPSSTEEERMEKIVATGFLVLGPHNYENQDKELLDLEIADEQVDTIGRAFLGMTIGCARCHDHKFDPIPTRDYYAMAGILLSTDSVRHSNVSKWYTQPLLPTAEQAAAIRQHEKNTAPLLARQAEVKRELSRLGQIPGRSNSQDGRVVALEHLAGIAADDSQAEIVGDWQESTSVGPWVGAGYLHDQDESGVEKRITWSLPIESPGRYQVRISYSPSSNRARNAPVTITHADGESTVHIDQTKRPPIDRLFADAGTYAFARGKATISISNDETDGVVIADAVQLVPVPGPADTFTSQETRKADEKENSEVEALQKEYQELTGELAKWEKKKPKLPTVMAVADKDKAEDTPVRIRGMVRNFGAPAPRGFLQVTLPSSKNQEPIPENRSGRGELARWITGPTNPLTARVLANRIWLHAFGEGIVASPDNFGTTGRLPTHPELLDHLATRLITNEWSVKRTLRELLLTRTWQLSSDPAKGSRVEEVDPDNLLLSHARLRKLDAESFRDSVLLLAGNLDSDRGGRSLPDGFKSEFGYEFTSLKRSVYLPVFRNQPHEIFAAFDFANPNFVVGQRSSSNLPTQALFLMNSPFIREQADAAAALLLEDARATTDEDRVALAYRSVLGRAPLAEETQLSLAFLKNEGHSVESPSPPAWAAFLRTLFSCVDFQYYR